MKQVTNEYKTANAPQPDFHSAHSQCTSLKPILIPLLPNYTHIFHSLTPCKLETKIKCCIIFASVMHIIYHNNLTTVNIATRASEQQQNETTISAVGTHKLGQLGQQDDH
jgi:hypothetical protein